MKRAVLILFSLFLPINLLAADHCTSPQKYTVDKRCYVTDEQKKTKPYNAVVMLDTGCTGTVLKGKDGNFYVLTAAHCVCDDKEVPVNVINVQTHNVGTVQAKKYKVGVSNCSALVYHRNDWAIYSIVNENRHGKKIYDSIISTNVSNVPLSNYFDNSYAVNSVGYGALKIMSDKEIQNFKQRYIKFLNDKTGKNFSVLESRYVFGEVGFDMLNSYAEDFLQYIANNDEAYYKAVFMDDALKNSRCTLTNPHVVLLGCQGWGGDSGGGLFDNEGNIMGINTTGDYVIGGTDHGRSEDAVILLDFLDTSNKANINLIRGK